MKLIIHIGTEKTATTTLQFFLYGNRKNLIDNGIYYPSYFDIKNHRIVVSACMDFSKTDDSIRRKQMYGNMKRQRFYGRTREMFIKDMSSVPSGVNTVLISSEHFHSRLTMASELESLREFIGDFFTEIKIVVYLRPQSALVASMYSTHLKAGGNQSFKQFLPTCNPDNPYFDYHRMLLLWAQEFGQSNMTVREFSRRKFVGNHICYDFLDLLGLSPVASYFSLPDDENTSFTRVGMYVLRLINTIFKPRDEEGNRRLSYKKLIRAVERQFRGGNPKLMSKDTARDVDNLFLESNKLVETSFGIRLFEDINDS